MKDFHNPCRLLPKREWNSKQPNNLWIPIVHCFANRTLQNLIVNVSISRIEGVAKGKNPVSQRIIQTLTDVCGIA